MQAWKLVVAEILAPALLLQDAKLLSHNDAVGRLCAQHKLELEKVATEAFRSASQSLVPEVEDDVWQELNVPALPLRMKYRWVGASAEGLLVLLQPLAQAPRTDLSRDDLIACLDELPVELHIRDADSGRYLYANRSELLHEKPSPTETLVGKTPAEIYTAGAADMVHASDADLLAQPELMQILKRQVGDTAFRASKQLVRPRDRQSPLIVRLAEDITEFAKSRAEHKQLMNDLCRAESIARVGSYRFDLKSGALRASRFLCELLGLKENGGPLSFDDVLDAFNDEQAHRLRLSHEALLRGEQTAACDISFVDARGMGVELELRCDLLRDEAGRPEAINGAFVDVTQRVQAERQVRYMAYHDVLTELPNRAYFMERAEAFLLRAQERQEHFALHLVDLDGFKEINDRMGHLAGDRVLQVVARRIRSSIKRGDLAARLGGDEFAILHERIDSPSVVKSLGERLVKKISEPIWVGNEEVQIGASMGVAIFNGDHSVEQVVMRADEMLYAVKRSGKGSFRLAI